MTCCASPNRPYLSPKIEEDSTEIYLSPLRPAFYLKFSENTEHVLSKTQEKILLIKMFFTSVDKKGRNFRGSITPKH